MLSKKMQDALNEQVNAELASAYLYLGMAGYFHDQDLPGFAHWTELQAQEELTHAKKIYDYIVDRGGQIQLMPVEAPPREWDSPLAVFQKIYDHEVYVTSLINKLVDLALEERDHPTNNMLQWFVAEQVEEEATADEVCKRIRMVQSAPGGMFMLDRELQGRAAPAAAE